MRQHTKVDTIRNDVIYNIRNDVIYNITKATELLKSARESRSREATGRRICQKESNEIEGRCNEAQGKTEKRSYGLCKRGNDAEEFQNWHTPSKTRRKAIKMIHPT